MAIKYTKIFHSEDFRNMPNLLILVRKGIPKLGILVFLANILSGTPARVTVLQRASLAVDLRPEPLAPPRHDRDVLSIIRNYVTQPLSVADTNCRCCLYNQLPIRVTGLGEFLPIGRLFSVNIF
jgi:hypothetical protein